MSCKSIATWFGVRPQRPTHVRRPSARPALETLEARDVPAVTATMTSFGNLSVQGDGASDTIVLREQNGMLSVDGVRIKVGTTFRDSITVASTRGFVIVNGGGGHDRLDLSRLQNVSGQIYGGTGNDTLFGTAMGDLMYGEDNNDNLYGNGGDDLIYGGNGLDGLYGGTGDDSLTGDALGGPKEADRFLVMEGQTEHKDVSIADAVIRFKNDARTWNASEIVAVDAGLQRLHLRTGNDNLLETSAFGTITFWRGGDKGNTAGENFGGTGKIVLYDRAFAVTNQAAIITIHEVGHNWDTEHANWNGWMSLSGWRSTKPSSADASKYSKGTDTDENWWYLKTATFARDYGRTNPREDFSTAWESYFIQRDGLPNTTGVTNLSTAKYNHLDSLFNSLR